MECLELVQTTVDETDVIPWLTQLIQLFFFIFFAPVAKKSLKNINLYVVVYKANGRLANPYCFWSPTQKKKRNLHLKQPTSEVAGRVVAPLPASWPSSVHSCRKMV
jgi:hypothetical protein